MRDAESWGTWREARAVVLVPHHLRATVAVAAIVGTVLICINQLDVMLAGHWGIGLLLKAAFTYFIPFAVSNYGLLAATRRRRRYR